MSNSLEIKLKEQKQPTFWERFMRWLHGGENQSDLLVMQVPKTGTNTEILLSQTEKSKLTEAVESPLHRSSDTTSFVRKSESGSDSQLII